MSSDNLTGADNQQERLWSQGWIVGCVDGEGCFSCPIFRNRVTKTRWQVQPCFTVVQSASSREVLEELARFFECGKVYVNRRHDNHREDFVPVPRVTICTLAGRNRPVLQGESVANIEKRQLRQVRNGHRADAAA